MNPRLLVPSRFRPLAGFIVLGLLAAGSLVSMPGIAADTPPEPAVRAADEQPAASDAENFFRSIVKIETRAVPDARSLASLGATREGTGIVIADDGLILTIGYLLVEADDVRIIDSRGRTLPARIVGYDHATGLGLVRTIVPLAAPGLTFGDSAKLAEREVVLVVNFAGADEVTLTRVVSKQPFTANWEYLLDQAIFTSPPALNWSGAALVDRDLKLVGVGSLIMRELPGIDVPMPGNMFVPIDALKPILADLVKNGRRAGPARPWLGVAADEIQGRLVVTRVSPDGPADDAGVKAGDIILGVAGDSVRTQDEFYRKVWGRGGAGTEIPLRVLQGVDVRDLKLQSIDRVQYFRPVTTY